MLLFYHSNTIKIDKKKAVNVLTIHRPGMIQLFFKVLFQSEKIYRECYERYTCRQQ